MWIIVNISSFCDSFSSRTIILKDGRIIQDTTNPNIASAKEALDALPIEEDE